MQIWLKMPKIMETFSLSHWELSLLLHVDVVRVCRWRSDWILADVLIAWQKQVRTGGGGCCGGDGANVPATAGRRAPVSQKPRRAHLHNDSSSFTSRGLGGRGSDPSMVLIWRETLFQSGLRLVSQLHCLEKAILGPEWCRGISTGVRAAAAHNGKQKPEGFLLLRWHIQLSQTGRTPGSGAAPGEDTFREE